MQLDEVKNPEAALEAAIFKLEASIKHAKSSIGSRSGPNTPEEVADYYNEVLKETIKLLRVAKGEQNRLLKKQAKISAAINEGNLDMTNKEKRRDLSRGFIKKVIDNRGYDASADLKEMIKVSKAVRMDAARDRVEI